MDRESNENINESESNMGIDEYDESSLLTRELDKEMTAEKTYSPLINDKDLLQVLTKEKKVKYESAFKLFVTKKNKSKVPKSAMLLIIRGLGRNLHPEQLNKWLQDLGIETETDNTLIDKKDFILIMRQPDLKKADNELILREAFRTFDTTESGQLDVVQLKKILNDYGESILNDDEIEEFVKESVDIVTNKINYLDYIKVIKKNVATGKKKKGKQKSKKKSKKKKKKG